MARLCPIRVGSPEFGRGHQVFQVSSQKAADLRWFLSRHAKSNGIDAGTLARAGAVRPGWAAAAATAQRGSADRSYGSFGDAPDGVMSGLPQLVAGAGGLAAAGSAWRLERSLEQVRGGQGAVGAPAFGDLEHFPLAGQVV